MKEYICKLWIAILSITVACLCIIYFGKITGFIGKILRIAMPFIYGACIAYLITPLCNRIKARLKSKNSHYMSIAITAVILVVALSIICVIIIPQSVKSIGDIMTELPGALERTQEIIDANADKLSWITEYTGQSLENINETIKNIVKNNIMPNIEPIITSIVSGATSIGKIVINLVMGLLISIFVLANRFKFATSSKRLVNALFGKRAANLILDEISVANKMFSGFFYGKIVDSLIVGVICFITLSILKMPYSLLVSVIVAITNIIPIIGPFIGAVPGIIIIFSVSWVQAIYFTIFIIILQQVDGHIIGPKCIGNATGLSTFWILFSIIVFGGLWGIVGMLIGVPLLAVIFDIGKKLVVKIETLRETRESKEIMK